MLFRGLRLLSFQGKVECSEVVLLDLCPIAVGVPILNEDYIDFVILEIGQAVELERMRHEIKNLNVCETIEGYDDRLYLENAGVWVYGMGCDEFNRGHRTPRPAGGRFVRDALSRCSPSRLRRESLNICFGCGFVQELWVSDGDAVHSLGSWSNEDQNVGLRSS